jgi:hypothetical protein
MLWLRLFGAHLGIPWSNEILDEHVGRLVLNGVATVVRDLGLPVAIATLPDISHSRTKVVELAPRLGQLVVLDAVLFVLDLGHAAARSGLQFAFDAFDFEPIANQGVQ